MTLFSIIKDISYPEKAEFSFIILPFNKDSILMEMATNTIIATNATNLLVHHLH